MNSVKLIGRTTDRIELSYTPQTQTAIGRFTLAVNRRKKEDGADFIRCKVWNRQAEIMSKYVGKGHRIAIEGRIETGSYKKDGKTVYTTEVVVEDFEFLESRHDEPRREEPRRQQRDYGSDFPDDLPDGYTYTNEVY